MKFYYERIMSCGCGHSFRQTTESLPLNRVGKAMAWESIHDFQLEHECKSEVRSSGWRRMRFTHESNEYKHRYFKKEIL